MPVITQGTGAKLQSPAASNPARHALISSESVSTAIQYRTRGAHAFAHACTSASIKLV
jgi:hypothetical protein